MRGTGLSVTAAALLLGGCMQTLIEAPQPSIAGDPNRVEVQSYLGGSVQDPSIVRATACSGREQLARVLVKRNFGQGLLSWLTFGLVAPSTLVYECANLAPPPLAGGDAPPVDAN